MRPAAVLALLVSAGLAACGSVRPPAGAGVLPEGVLIAHALGGIEGADYTNSLEAAESSYDAGRRWFEVDLTVTADGGVVAFHPGHEPRLDTDTSVRKMTTAQFLEHRYDGRFTTTSFRRLLELVARAGDTYVVTDTKWWTPWILRAVRHDVLAAPAVAPRVIPQIYRPADLALLETARRDWSFPFVIFTLYQTKMSDAEILAFVDTAHIPVVAASTGRFTPALAAALHARGVRVLVHTVNRRADVEKLTREGADGFYTDFYFPPPQRSPGVDRAAR